MWIMLHLRIQKHLIRSNMETFAAIVNGWQPLIIVAKLSISDVSGGPGMYLCIV